MSDLTHNDGPWSIGAAKQCDIPIEARDLYGRRLVVARIPFGARQHAAENAALVRAAPDLQASLRRLLAVLDDPRRTVGDTTDALSAARDALESSGVKP